MLDKFHLRGIEESDFTSEQWGKLVEFIGHNFGNLVGAATLTLGCCRDQLLTPKRIDEKVREIRTRHQDIMASLVEMKLRRELADAGDSQILPEVEAKTTGGDVDEEWAAQGRQRGEAAGAGPADQGAAA